MNCKVSHNYQKTYIKERYDGTTVHLEAREGLSIKDSILHHMVHAMHEDLIAPNTFMKDKCEEGI